MMSRLTPSQKRTAIVVSLLVYAVLLAGLFGWLVFKSEDTRNSRLAKTPSVTVSLVKPAEVPSSWTAPDKTLPDAAATAEAPPAMPQAAPLPSETKIDTAPQPTAPEQKPEQPVAAPASTPATEAETTPQQPSVQTNPVDQAAPPAPAATDSALPAWRKFARPFKGDGKPRIALIITDLGMAATAAQAAIQETPGDVTLAFSSMAPDLETLFAKARAAGHETLLTVPMEPENYPKNDPGPNTLLTALPDKENVSRMDWALSRAEGYVGVMPAMGAKFVTDESRLVPVLDDVRQHGLLVVDNTTNNNSKIPNVARLGRIPFVRADVLIDAAAARTAIDTQLAQLETIAKEKGSAIGIAFPYPVTFEKLKPWVDGLAAKGIVLAPVTALVGGEPVAADQTSAAPAATPVNP